MVIDEYSCIWTNLDLSWFSLLLNIFETISREAESCLSPQETNELTESRKFPHQSWITTQNGSRGCGPTQHSPVLSLCYSENLSSFQCALASTMKKRENKFFFLSVQADARSHSSLLQRYTDNTELQSGGEMILAADSELQQLGSGRRPWDCPASPRGRAG